MADMRKQLTDLEARRKKEADDAQNEIKELQFKVTWLPLFLESISLAVVRGAQQSVRKLCTLCTKVPGQDVFITGIQNPL